MNDFADTPQLGGWHDPMQPNFIQRVAVFTIYSRMNAGSRDGEVSVLWFKAMGVHAISVPGPYSHEYSKPFANPRKFEGLLPVAWRDEGDTIYTVPARSASLAHVIPATAVVASAPINGLDTTRVQRYVNALEDASAPGAQFTWKDDRTATMRANVRPGDVISVQITATPGWTASINGVPQRVDKDGLGFLIVKPACQGDCSIVLRFDGGFEWDATCFGSIVSIGILLVSCLRHWLMPHVR